MRDEQYDSYLAGMIASVIMVILIAFSPAQAQVRQPASYESGKVLIQQNNIPEAFKVLRQVHRNQPHFLKSFLAVQRMHYKLKKWDQFFAYQLYYKSSFIQGKRPSEAILMPELLLLESIALAKICKFDQARKALNLLENLTKLKGEQLIPEFEQVLYSVEAIEYFENIKKNNKHSLKEVKPLTKDLFWNLRYKQLAKLDNPLNMRMRVKSACAGAEDPK